MWSTGTVPGVFRHINRRRSSITSIATNASSYSAHQGLYHHKGASHKSRRVCQRSGRLGTSSTSRGPTHCPAHSTICHVLYDHHLLVPLPWQANQTAHQVATLEILSGCPEWQRQQSSVQLQHELEPCTCSATSLKTSLQHNARH